MDLGVINFPDKVFKKHLVTHYDKDEDGEISLKEALSIKKIDCSDKGIKSIAGIEFFSNLENLNCSKNEIKTIDLSYNYQLKHLSCYDNSSLSELNIQNNPVLITLHCRACCLESLDCSQNRELRSLSCGFNPIKKIDLCHNTKIENLYVRRCKLEKLELRSLKNLQFLNCSENKLYEIQLYENKELIHLDCNCNDLHNDLYLGANTKLNYIDCYRNTCLDSITISEGQLIAEIRSQIKPMTESYRQYLLWKEYQAEKENDVDFYENERYYYDGWSKEDVESGLCDAYEDDLDARWNND